LASIKEWSTGEIGNNYPTRETSTNPNTKGLTTKNRPGIEAYIEEDPVEASIDNRPFKNLVANDVLINQNSSDVASEVDSGVFKERYSEYDIAIQPQDTYSDPENTNSNIYITPIRIQSGSSIINGEVTRIGNQQIIYFIKDNNQILFPQYSSSLQNSIVILDENYKGLYKPVYDGVTEGLPANFENYEIQIVNKYLDNSPDRIAYFKTYRDWEDIVPYKPEVFRSTKEIVNFVNDVNYGQDSEGYWIRSGSAIASLLLYSDLSMISVKKDGDVYYVKETNKYYKYAESNSTWVQTVEDRDVNGIKGTVTSNITLQKDIVVKDKYLSTPQFTRNLDGTASHSVVTDGIFFEDITWTDTVKIDSTADILDMYVDSNEDIYFVTKGLSTVINSVTGMPESKKSLFRLTKGAIELENKLTGADASNFITYTRMRRIGDYLFLLGTHGFIKTWNFTKNFNTETVDDFIFFTNNPTTEAFRDVYLWKGNIFIATDTKLYYQNFTGFDPLSSSFTEINVQLNIIAQTEDWKNFLDTYADLPTTPTENDIYYINDESKAYIYKQAEGEWKQYTINPIIQNITKIDSVKGNTVALSTLVKDVDNLLSNPSFENSTQGIIPINWNIDTLSNSTLLTVQNSASDNIYGNFKSFLTKSTLDTSTHAYQDIELTLTAGEKYTFSTYLNSTFSKAFSSSIYVEEYKDLTLVSSSIIPYSLTGSENTWTRFSVTHTVIDSTSTKLRVKVENNNYYMITPASGSTPEVSASLQIDNCQLELGSEANDYVENFNYLFIGFRKVYGDITNTPYALIDLEDKFEIKYNPNTYGYIETINDVKFIKNNLLYAISDTKIFSINFLNNRREYNRVSVQQINNESDDFNLKNKIESLETLEFFNNRIFVGGTVANSVIKISASDLSTHTISLSYTGGSAKENLMKLLGSVTTVSATSKFPYYIEFNRTLDLLESEDGVTYEGQYIPGKTYSLTITFDDNINYDQTTIDIVAPSKYLEPWKITQIADKMNVAFTDIQKIKPSIKISSNSSSTIVDGFMSFGKLELVKHVRGDVHKIFIRDGEETNFYLARNTQIFKSKYDPNVLKTTTGEYIDYNWDLNSSIHSVREYKNIYNKQIVVSDDIGNTSYINIGVDNNCSLLQGSVKLKTNTNTQVGFAENIDYEIDYLNARIIRRYTDNLCQNNDFGFGSTGDTPNNWKKWGNISGGIGSNGVNFSKIIDNTGFSQYISQLYILPVSNTSHPFYPSSNLTLLDDQSYISSHLDTNASAYQIYKPSNLNVGDTYTFSVYLNSNHIVSNLSSYITLVESESFKTSGYQLWKFSTPKTPSSSTGIPSNNIDYGATIVINGNPYTLSAIKGSSIQTINDVINQINGQIMSRGAKIEWVSSGNGYFKLYSTTPGLQSSISITTSIDQSIFGMINDINNNPEIAVPGSDPKVESAGLQLYNYTDSVGTIKPEYGTSPYSFSVDSVGKWKRIEVTHTVTNPSSDCFRVEVRSGSQYPVYISKSQIELNMRATPWVQSYSRSAIDPDSILYIDFVEFKDLKAGSTFEDGSVEYIFDSNNRNVILKNINETSNYYLNYKYTRIFNPYSYGDRLPIYRVIYDSRDDYFLYEYEGRIWSINQMLSMLSFDKQDPIYITYEYHFPRIDIVKIRNTPDIYGNYCYLVKGEANETNPYRPFDRGTYTDQYTVGVDSSYVSDIINNEILYEFSVTSYDYSKNALYDRRIYIDAKDNTLFNISLTPETVAYMSFNQDFNATNGMMPIYTPNYSKIVSIIKNFKITQKEEIGAWREGYDSTLRKLTSFPGASFCIFVSTDFGNDDSNGQSEAGAVRTIKRALELTYYNTQNDRRNNIILTTSGGIVNEDIRINTGYKNVGGVQTTQVEYEILIFASTYCLWRGALQNETPVTVQGVYFENSGIYPFDVLNLFYCTLDDTNINCTSPQQVIIKNSEVKNNHNSVIRVSDILSPSPFIFPYEKNPRRDDSVAPRASDLYNIATSDNESIAPGDSWYDPLAATQPQGQYQFYRCLVYGTKDNLVQYDPADEINNWISSFQFDQCTITQNKNLFATNKYNLSVSFSESIVVGNGEIRSNSSEIKMFDSNSNISMLNCFIDFSKDSESIYVNYGEGIVTNRTTCKGGVGSDPMFLTITDNMLDFHLRSIARGSSADSPCLNASSQAHDLGCYDELRERTEVDIPQKLRSKVAHFREGVKYPIVLNSEKITFTMEFKPIGSSFTSAVLLDTRINSKDEDYIVVCYNNNATDDQEYIIDKNPSNTLDMPNRFRVVVVNKEKIYSIVSPISIFSDEQYQQWHRLTFSINYELVYKTRTSFVDSDRQQNIITFYHNDRLAIESFIKYNLQYSVNGGMLAGDYNGTNAWNYNDISSVVTFGSDYMQSNLIECYCSEIRIDNRFISRKELQLWMVKQYQFNDPYSKINEATLAKTLDPSTLNEYWSLKTKFNRGAKWNQFLPETSSRFTYLDKQFAWVLTRPTNNIFIQSDFNGMHNAQIVSSSAIDWNTLTGPIIINGDWILSSGDSARNPYDSSVVLNIAGTVLYNLSDLDKMLSRAFSQHPLSDIKYMIMSDNRIKFYTQDYGVQSLSINMANDYELLNFTTPVYPDAVLIGYPVHSGKEFITALGIAVKINQNDVATSIAQKTVTIINLAYPLEFTAEVVLVDGVESNRIAITNKIAGSVNHVRQGDLISISPSTSVMGDELTQEISEILFIDNNISNNSLFDGHYFEIFSTSKKYYIWYKLFDNEVDPTPNATGWFVEGITPGSVGSTGNQVWFEERAEYVNLSNISLAVQRTSTIEDDLLIYQKLELTQNVDADGNLISPTVYYMSVNAYYDGYLKSTDLKVYLITSNGTKYYEDFDTITRNIGNWWILTKKINVVVPQMYSVGIQVLNTQVLYINGMQLEKNTFATPFIPNVTSEQNQIVISKSLMGEEKGTIFFRWKPLFDYRTSEERVLLEVLGRKYDSVGNQLDIADLDKGLCIRYKYNERRDIGTLTYSINDVSGTNNNSWAIKVPETSWNNWHSSSIVYDFNTGRFYFAFDFYRQVIDSPLEPWIDRTTFPILHNALWTPLYIGRDAMSGVDKNISQQIDVIIPGDTNGSLSGKYWRIYSRDTSYYVWYSINGMSSINPGIPASTGIVVVLEENDDASTVAQKTLMELGNYPEQSLSKDFLVVRRNNIITVTNKVAGLVTEANTATSGAIINTVVQSANSKGIQDYSYETAEIAVKDIILTSGTISETEELKWHNSYEFFNEYLLINTLNSYQQDINNLIFNVNNIISSPLEMSRRIDTVENQMSGLQISQGNLESDVNLLTNLVQSSQAVALQQIKDNLNAISTTVSRHSNSLLYMQDGLSGNWSELMSTSTGGKYNIYDIRNDFNSFSSSLASEISSRITGDQTIRDDLVSTYMGKGAALIGINDKHSVFSDLSAIEKNIEAALQSLAGYDPVNINAHRTTESVYSNALSINQLNNITSTTTTDFNYSVSGNSTGDGWSRDLSSNSGYNIKQLRIDSNSQYNSISLIKDGRLTSAQGYQILRFNGVVDSLQYTGLLSTDYSLNITVDGVNSNYVLSGSSCSTWTDLIATFNSTVSGATLSITEIDSLARLVSNTYGSTSGVTITGGTLFTSASLKAPGPQLISIDNTVQGLDDSWVSATMNLFTLRSNLDTEIAARTLYENNLLSNAVNKGASLIGINDAANLITATNVEGALQELAGAGRTTQTLKSLSDKTDTSNINIAAHLVEINKMKDGAMGTTWTSTSNLKNHETHLTTLDSTTSSQLIEINKMKDGATGATWDSSMNLKALNDRTTTNEQSITSIETALGDLSQADQNEIENRIIAVQAVRDDLASGSAGKGASLIAVQDVADNFLGNNVETVLAELQTNIEALSGAISWQEPVASYSDLPITGNKLSDSRTVRDDDDGKPAQYLCVAITGSREAQWTKIADIDWHNASDIAFNPAPIAKAQSTTVQTIVEELWARTNDLQIATKFIEETNWSATVDPVDEMYVYNFVHNLDTNDVVVNVIESTTNSEIGVDEIIRIDFNTIQLRSSNKISANIYCFASVNNYSSVVSDFDLAGTRYSKTITHNLRSRNVMFSVFDVTTGMKVEPGDVTIIDENNIKIYVETPTVQLNVYVVKKIQTSVSKDITAWNLSGGLYTAQLEVGAMGYDAVYKFFNPSTMKNIDVESIQIANGRLIIKRTSNTLLRLVVLK